MKPKITAKAIVLACQIGCVVVVLMYSLLIKLIGLFETQVPFKYFQAISDFSFYTILLIMMELIINFRRKLKKRNHEKQIFTKTANLQAVGRFNRNKLESAITKIESTIKNKSIHSPQEIGDKMLSKSKQIINKPKWIAETEEEIELVLKELSRAQLIDLGFKTKQGLLRTSVIPEAVEIFYFPKGWLKYIPEGTEVFFEDGTRVIFTKNLINNNHIINKDHLRIGFYRKK